MEYEVWCRTCSSILGSSSGDRTASSCLLKSLWPNSRCYFWQPEQGMELQYYARSLDLHLCPPTVCSQKLWLAENNPSFSAPSFPSSQRIMAPPPNDKIIDPYPLQNDQLRENHTISFSSPFCTKSMFPFWILHFHSHHKNMTHQKGSEALRKFPKQKKEKEQITSWPWGRCLWSQNWWSWQRKTVSIKISYTKLTQL